MGVWYGGNGYVICKWIVWDFRWMLCYIGVFIVELSKLIDFYFGVGVSCVMWLLVIMYLSYNIEHQNKRKWGWTRSRNLYPCAGLLFDPVWRESAILCHKLLSSLLETA